MFNPENKPESLSGKVYPISKFFNLMKSPSLCHQVDCCSLFAMAYVDNLGQKAFGSGLLIDQWLSAITSSIKIKESEQLEQRI